MDLLPALVHEPAVPATAAVIWLHGLGADGSDFAPVVPHLGLDDVRFVFPHAPAMPVTVNGGYVMPSWYDIRTLDRVPDREDADHVRISADRVRALIAREVARGVPEERVVLAGFSQGAALALYTGLRHPRPLAGLICLSGYLVVEDTLEREASDAGRGATVLFGHGTEDDVVIVAAGRLAHDRVRALGASTEWHDWPMGHGVSPEEIGVVRRWLHGRLRRQVLAVGD